MNHKIAFIIPYFGSLPSYFQLFVNSIRNKPFNILFFSDNPAPAQLPQNIIWRIVEIEEIKSLFNRRLNIEVALDKPYKFCDLKPSYGFVFEEYLKGYDFWGSIDTDLVVGNFEHYVNDTVLEQIDVYSGIKEYLSGSFFLVRNNAYCNEIFKKSRDWEKIFTTKKNFDFDECGGHYYQELKSGKSLLELNTPVQSFTEMLLIEAKNGLRLLFSDSILEPRGTVPVYVTDNEVLYQGMTYLVLHYIYYKQTYHFYTSSKVSALPCYINSLGVFKKRPTLLNTIFSENIVNAISKKIEINLKKLKI